MRFSALPDDDYNAVYKRAFAPVDVPTEVDKERLREEIFTTQQLVLDELRSQWTETEDFEVGADFDYCYHICGGIYSDRIVCPEYIAAIIDALGEAPKSAKWTCHTACETDNWDSEFFVRDGAIYLPKGMDAACRRQLGCQD